MNINNDIHKYRVYDNLKKEYLPIDNYYISPEGLLKFYDGKRGKFSEKRYIKEKCTGKKDKQGRLIFENDIIGGVNGSINGSGMNFTKQIQWFDEFDAGFNVPFFSADCDSTHWYSIIGNIHDNPELLEGKNGNNKKI